MNLCARLLGRVFTGPEMNNISPVVFFTYNRPLHTEQAIFHLLQNAEARRTPLFIFSDGAKDNRAEAQVTAVRKILRKIAGFKSVQLTQRSGNLGLANSIISGVTEILKTFESVIVLEDDITVSKNFLSYMNKALNQYRLNPKVASIHGWNFPLQEKNLPDTFFLRGADCWGWATWKRAWNEFEPDGDKLLMQLESQNLFNQFDLDGAYPYTQMLKDQIAGKNNSWAIRWHASMFLRDKVTLHPGKSLVQNIGLDGSGVHTGQAKAYQTQLSQKRELQFPPEVVENEKMRKIIIAYLRKNHGPRFIPHLKSKIRTWVSQLKDLQGRF